MGNVSTWVMIAAVALAALQWEVKGKTIWGWGSHWLTARSAAGVAPDPLDSVLVSPSADDLLISAARLLVAEGRLDDADDVFAVVTKQRTRPEVNPRGL